MHESLVNFLFTVHAEAEFTELQAIEPKLARFTGASALLDHLTQVSHDLEETDQIYAGLVRAVQAGCATSVAHSLLWCGLWPGLDRVYRRRLRLFRQRLDELTSAISIAFTELVSRIDLQRVARVAATLVRSTDRDMMYALRREWTEGTKLSEGFAHLEGGHPSARAETRDSGRAEGEDGDASHSIEALPDPIAVGARYWLELAELRQALLPVLGDDTDLILRVVVLDELQSQVAVDMGVSADAARKRFQRALQLLRRHVADDAGGH
jgi:DNA-directed RNA polymerase specialized sigma24 family protein